MDEQKPGNRPSEKSLTNDTRTPNTPTMEVHHHAHAETHGEKKKVRHYFFEFFMLFLAVFAGSVAEYYLEHVVEHKREKQYMESMIEDLRVDTSNLSSTIAQNKRLVAGLDTLVQILDTPGKIVEASETMGQLYFYNRIYTSDVSTMEFSTRTISQLKNAGNMRLIRDVKVSDSIMDYEQGIQLISMQQKAYIDISMDILKKGNELFDNKYSRFKGYHSKADFLKQHFRLLTNDSVKLIQYDNMVDMDRSIIKGYKAMLEEQKKSAQKLILFLKREYDL